LRRPKSRVERAKNEQKIIKTKIQIINEKIKHAEKAPCKPEDDIKPSHKKHHKKHDKKHHKKHHKLHKSDTCKCCKPKLEEYKDRIQFLESLVKKYEDKQKSVSKLLLV
jgi:chromosome segregation ATPase